MNILVLCSQYPTQEDYSRGNFFHVRNKYYIDCGINVDVLNYEANDDYCIDGINVYTEQRVNSSAKNYDLILCHAPKLQQHFKFLRAHPQIKRVVFVFHGNEVLDTYKIAPYRYPYLPSAKLHYKLTRKLKDHVKLRILKREFKKYNSKSYYIFVSNWMKKNMMESVGISYKLIENRNIVINNAVGKPFEENQYDVSTAKKYDFITIRSQLDGSKYAVDLVVKLAQNNPKCSFLLIGKGDYFKYNSLPDNITWIEKTFSHEEILNYLNSARCALLLTRWDSQGLMTCETATYGMPTITSNISVCLEMLHEFKNVRFVNNDSLYNVDLLALLNEIENQKEVKKNTKFFAQNTMSEEVSLFRTLVNDYE